MSFIKQYGQALYRGASLLLLVLVLYFNTKYVSITEYKTEQAAIRTDLLAQQTEVKQNLTQQQVAIKADLQNQQVVLGANLVDFQNKNTVEHMDFFKLLNGVQQTLAVINEQNKRISDHEDRLRLLEKSGK